MSQFWGKTTISYLKKFCLKLKIQSTGNYFIFQFLSEIKNPFDEKLDIKYCKHRCFFLFCNNR